MNATAPHPGDAARRLRQIHGLRRDGRTVAEITAKLGEPAAGRVEVCR